MAQATSSGGRSASAPTAAVPYGKGGGGGGGGDTPNLPPIIAATKGSYFGISKTGPGEYTILAPVPIGSILQFKDVSPYNYADPNGNITSENWSGGSDFSGSFSSGYFSTPANAAPPQSQSTPQAPVLTNPTYNFIVDATPGLYTITVDVNYKGDGSGAASLMFTSVKPQGSLDVQQVGTQNWGLAGPAQVILDPPIQISGTTGISVDQNTSGQFMFMQVLTSTLRQYTDPLGRSWHLSNTAAFPGFAGSLLDSRGDATAYPYNYQSSTNTFGSWYLPDSNGNTSAPSSPWAPPWMQDGPGYGPVAANNLQVSAKDSFSTYLMYQPFVQGVWIALSQINWSWSETATNNGGTWTGTTAPQPTPADSTTPEGAAAFPSWVNLTSNFRNVGFIQGP